MLSARNIQSRRINFDDYRLIRDEDFASEHERTQVASGDVLLTIVGTIGRTAVVPGDIPPFALQRSVAVLKLTEGIDPAYLAYALESPNLQKHFEENAKGTAQKGFYLKALSEIELPLAPLNMQKRIADKLDAVLARVDACRERLDRVPAVLKRFRQAVLTAATSGKLTEEWREENARDSEWPLVELGSAARDFSYGSAAKSSKSGSVAVLRMGNIQDGCLDWSDLVYTSDPEEISKYRLAIGDVLFNRTNSPELVGKTAVYQGERDAIYAGYLIRVRCTDKLLSDYLNYCLNSPAGRDYCWRVKSDGVSQSNINAKKLAAFEFGLPSIEEQHEIVRRVQALFAYADRLEARYTAARSQVEGLTPALLTKAFRGELVPQDPNDEPASVLLERIRAARAEQPTAKRGRKPPATRVPRAPREKAAMTKSRQDDDVLNKPYLAGLLREAGGIAGVEDLFRRAELPVTDFYKQLAWEVENGHIRDDETRLEAA
jgi:type I restriction enzyme S subunit